jgi:hypothetical protein
MRVDGGQHQIWCTKVDPGQQRLKRKAKAKDSSSILQLKTSTFDFNVSCRQHIHIRNKLALEEFVMSHLPRLTNYPR